MIRAHDLDPRPSCAIWHLQVVTEDGQHGNGWLTVQRLPEELWGSGTAKRVPLRRLALVYTPEEAAPLLQEELLKV